jgi:hypothetical protein
MPRHNVSMVLRVSRRPLAITMIVLGGAALALVAAALWNPWRLTMLYPLAHVEGTVSVLVLAGALVAGAALTLFADTGRRAVFGLVAALVAIPALCVGLPVVSLTFRTVSGHGVLAVSPDGGYAVVKYTVDTSSGPRTHLYVRSRELLLSREARTPLAECPFDPFDRGVPAEAVRFTSETTVAVPVRDESTTVVRFDPDTLAPERTVAMCGSG